MSGYSSHFNLQLIRREKETDMYIYIYKENELWHIIPWISKRRKEPNENEIISCKNNSLKTSRERKPGEKVKEPEESSGFALDLVFHSYLFILF